ncbi:MAG TPA: hypothetical protein VMV18_03305 [bacterium]|nr:hypothetical protein [bacterium]
MAEEKRFTLTPRSKTAFNDVAQGVGAAYQKIVVLMEQEVLSNDEFEFFTEATYALVDALKRLEALAKRAA